MIELLSKLKPIDIIMLFLILGVGLMIIAFYKKPKEKEGLKAAKPRRDQITRADILDAKLSRDHEQYVAMSKVLDEHERAIAG